MPKAVWSGVVIAESTDVKVVDGYTYFPAEAVDRQYLRPSDHKSVCAWKGTASYFDVVIDGQTNPAAAWEYRHPSEQAAPLVSGRVAFWRGVRIEGDDPGDNGGLLSRLRSRAR